MLSSSNPPRVSLEKKKKKSVVNYNDNALKMAYSREWRFIAAGCDKSGLRENIVCVLEIIAFKIKTLF